MRKIKSYGSIKNCHLTIFLFYLLHFRQYLLFSKINEHCTHYFVQLNTYDNDNNFITWLALKAFIIYNKIK